MWSCALNWSVINHVYCYHDSLFIPRWPFNWNDFWPSTSSDYLSKSILVMCSTITITLNWHVCYSLRNQHATRKYAVRNIKCGRLTMTFELWTFEPPHACSFRDWWSFCYVHLLTNFMKLVSLLLYQPLLSLFVISDGIQIFQGQRILKLEHHEGMIWYHNISNLYLIWKIASPFPI